MRQSYKMIVESDDKGWVKVSVPAFPGILAEAHTKQQAIEFAENSVKSALIFLKESGKSAPASDIDAIVLDI